MRTVEEIKSEINSVKAKQTADSKSAGNYSQKVQELTDKKDDLQNQLNTLYNTYSEADSLCSDTALNMALSLYPPNECCVQFVQYYIKKIGEYRVSTLSAIDRMTGRLDRQIKKLEGEISSTQAMADTAQTNANNADSTLSNLYYELQQAEALEL